jgi:hypothetical protein
MRANVCAMLALAGSALVAACAEVGGPVRPLANDFVVVCESPSPSNIFCYTPGLVRLNSGRLVATMDFGGPGVKKNEPHGRVFTSDDGGATWTNRVSFPFVHARPFVAGNALYVLGHSGDLRVIRSDDNGTTWHAPAKLTENQHWHQSACNVWYAHDSVYLVMERRVSEHIKLWPWGKRRGSRATMRRWQSTATICACFRAAATRAPSPHTTGTSSRSTA